MHPFAHRLADAIGHVLTQLDPSSARINHLKAHDTCKRQEVVLLVPKKDMASADKHQDRSSSKPVGADSLEQQDDEEASFFQLNQLVYK